MYFVSPPCYLIGVVYQLSSSLGMAMTRSKAIYRAGFEPLPGAIFTIPFPHAFEHGCSEKESVDFSLDSLEMLLKRETKGDETAVNPIGSSCVAVSVPY